jgi:hypothetical protein
VVRATNTHNDQGNPCCVLEYHASFNYHSPIYPNGPPSSPSAGSIAMAMALNSHPDAPIEMGSVVVHVTSSALQMAAPPVEPTNCNIPSLRSASWFKRRMPRTQGLLRFATLFYFPKIRSRIATFVSPGRSACCPKIGHSCVCTAVAKRHFGMR